MNYDQEPPVEVSRYREMQRAFPGVESFYRLILAKLHTSMSENAKILVVGAGGGREIESICNNSNGYQVTGVDPSQDMLDIAQWYSENSARPTDVTLIKGTCADVESPHGGFDAATSLLVMHFLPDSEDTGGKLSYLNIIRQRLKPGALLVHADISFQDLQGMADDKAAFLEHAILTGFHKAEMQAGSDMIAKLPIISTERTEQLFAASGFSQPKLFFKSLWYHGWTAIAV